MDLRAWCMAVALALPLAGAPAWAQMPSSASDPDAIPEVESTTGTGQIAEAWLIAPTTRYSHFVLGRQFEAGGVRVRTRAGTVVTLLLDPGLVFEDRQPRLWDIDGDGAAELVLVLTALDRGASLAAYELTGNRLALKAQTEFIGAPFRWLNPAGLADFDGDGRPEIALVAMPHLAKRLEVYRFADGGLVQVYAMGGVSNHRPGSPHQGMSGIADVDGDGTAELLVPDGTRQNLLVIGFAGLTPEVIGRYPLPAPADGEILVVDRPGGFRVTVGLENATAFTLDL